MTVPARSCTGASSQGEGKGTAGPCGPNLAASRAGLGRAMEGELWIELLEAAVPGTKLSPGSSLNDHTGSYATVLIERGGGVAMTAGGAGEEPASRRDNTSLQGTATTAAAAREAGEDVIMRVVLLRLIDTATFNLAFLTATEAAAAP
ncbi:hypothetical protein BDFG_06657 [Blastomyces dermatitidis ATCC 26199]|nr:hypothetical protein BDFG_06657 [Blastomyces dermatitidis ATCC 26199]